MGKRIGIGIIGMGWMGGAHALAYTRVKPTFPEYDVEPDLVACADVSEEIAATARERYGFSHHTTDWRSLLERDDIDLICVTSPNFLHHEMGVAVAQAGKHLVCEKPVGRNPAETLDIARAVRDAGVNSAVGYNYRWVPVVQHARNLVADKSIGDVQVYNGRFFSLYGSDPLGFWSWRFDKDQAGTGAVGDLLVHAVDMAQWLNSPIVEVVADRQTYITERPVNIGEKGTHYGLGETTAPRKPVSNEDYVGMMVRFANGSRGVFDASRTVYGPKCEMAFNIYGSRGSIRWNFERMNEVEVCLKDSGVDGYTQVLTSVEHPFHSRFNPGDAIALGYPDLKTIEAAHFLQAIAEGVPFSPGLADAAQVADVTNALIKSWESGSWEKVESSL